MTADDEQDALFSGAPVLGVLTYCTAGWEQTTDGAPFGLVKRMPRVIFTAMTYEHGYCFSYISVYVPFHLTLEIPYTLAGFVDCRSVTFC